MSDKIVEQLKAAEQKVEETVRQELQNNDMGQYLESDYYKALGAEAETGAIFGACAGMFSRMAARFAMISCGGFFVALQLLQHSGYVNVEWNKVNEDLTKRLDLNNDGKIDQDDAKIAYEKYLKTLTYKLPSTTGFALAFFLGFKGKILK